MILRNMFSMSGLNALKAVAALGISSMVAGAVAPQQYGLAAFAIPLMALITLLTDLGLSSAIVRDKDLDSQQAGAAIALMGLGGVVGGLLLAFSAGWIERVTRLTGLSALLIGFSVVATLAICATAPRALLERRLLYGRIAAIETAAILAALVSFVIAARARMGIGSLVVYHVVLQAVRAVVFSAVVWPLFKLNLQFRGIRNIIQIGAWVFASNLLAYAARNAGTLMVGTFLGAAALGLYGLASQFMTAPLMLLSWPISGVLLSTLARMRGETQRKADLICAIVGATAAVTFPFMAFLAFGARYPIEHFYGARWSGLAQIVALLAPVGAIQSVAAYNSAVLVESGAVRLNFALAILNGVGLSGIFILSSWLGFHAMIVTYCASAILVSLIMIACMCRVGGLRLRQFLECLRPGITASLAGLLVAYACKGLVAESLTDWLEMAALYLLAVLGSFLGNRARVIAIFSLLVSANAVAAPIGEADAAFNEWVDLVTKDAMSPAIAESTDRVVDWTAPDGQQVHLVVRNPRPRAGASTVTLARVPPGADARPYFEDAIASIRAQQAGYLLIPPGTYEFKSLSNDKLGHWVIRGLSDVTIRGDQATLRFAQNADGIYLSENSRLKIQGLKLEYSLHTASLGTIQAAPGGNVLVIDPRFPVNATDAVTYLSEYDPAAHNWVKGGRRIILPPGSPTPARYVGNQTYESPAFKAAPPGSRFVVFHHWYGGVALKMADLTSPPQSEDLTFENMTIASGPGMGMLAYGMKRGLAIVDSTIAPGNDPANLISTEYDAVHILIAGGDVIIQNNHIAGQGDDGINFNSPVQPVAAVADNGSTVTLSAYSRFIRPGDTLAFFDSDAVLIGKSQVTHITAKGGLNNEISLATPIPDMDTRSIARDLSLINRRYLIYGNTITRCQCHGILLQAPFGLVAHNTISDIAFNGIRLLMNVGSFKEGAGAFDVIVKDNTISGTGRDTSLRMPWAAISSYGAIRNNEVTAQPVNSDLQIIDNHISNVPQGCITVLSTQRATVTGNTCASDSTTDDASLGIEIRNSAGVLVERNKLLGRFAGKLAIDQGRRPLPPRNLHTK